jgi:beta-lactamase class A
MNDRRFNLGFRIAGIAVLAALCAACASTQAPTAESASASIRLAPTSPVGVASSDRLSAQIERLQEISGGRVGVGAIHLESGREYYFNRDERFPMASAYKVPIAARLFDTIDRGELTLTQMIELRPEDIHPGSGTLSALFDDPGVALSIHNLTELMLLISDNSATDVLLRTVGGGRAVTDRLRAIGVEGIDVSRPTIHLIANSAGAADPPEGEEMTPQMYRDLRREMSQQDRRTAAERFNADPRDTSTPEAMARLLQKIWSREILSEESSAQLLDIMYRCQTGAARIKGLLPPGTRVAHKTGTLGQSTCDVGIIDLPGDAGHLVAAIFVKEATESAANRERTIAEIARTLYDCFLLLEIE